MCEMHTGLIGVLTTDVRLYYDLMAFLKSKDLGFRMLDFERPIPTDIGVVLTSEGELDSIGFEQKIAVTDIELCIRQARLALHNLSGNELVIVGVDPGPEPGIAVLCADQIIETRQAQNTEHAADIILGILSDYSFSQCVLKIGDGSPEERDRIIELVASNFDIAEIVDENRTSKVGEGHVDSAVRIARC